MKAIKYARKIYILLFGIITLSHTHSMCDDIVVDGISLPEGTTKMTIANVEPINVTCLRCDDGSACQSKIMKIFGWNFIERRMCNVQAQAYQRQWHHLIKMALCTYTHSLWCSVDRVVCIAIWICGIRFGHNECHRTQPIANGKSDGQ